MSVIKSELESFIDQAMYHTQEPAWLADGIISLIESKLPVVEEECSICTGRGGQFVSNYDYSSKLNIWEQCDKCRESNHIFARSTGKTTRPMTLDEAVEKLHERN